MNPAIADLIKLLARIAVEKHFDEITEVVPKAGRAVPIKTLEQRRKMSQES